MDAGPEGVAARRIFFGEVIKMESARARRGPRMEREAAWRRRIEEQARSGMSAREFCRREGVGEHSFYQWRRRLAQEAAVSGADRSAPRGAGFGKAAGVGGAAGSIRGAPKFARLLIGEAADPGRGMIEIESRGGFLVRVGPGMDRATLIEALSAIEALGAAEAAGR